MSLALIACERSAVASMPNCPTKALPPGVAAMVPRAGFSAELLIAAADAALYRAKAGGKNRLEAAGSEHY